MTDEFKYESVGDEELNRSWMTRVGAMALMRAGMKDLGIEDDTNTKLALLYQAMHSLDDLDFMVAYTNLFGDYMYDKFYSDDLDDEAKELLETFKSEEGFIGDDDNE
jgi:ABC-type proline/glycine betaine transport system substrate-binding protein